MAIDRDWQRLAELARDRRIDLGLTQEDVRAAGGPSTATLRLIEGALQDNYQPAILRRLEDGLQWEHGSVRRVLAGGDPVLISPPLPGSSGGSGGAAGITAPPARPLSARERADQRWGGPVGEMIAVAMAEPLDQVRAEVAAARDRDVPERQIFADSREAYIWMLDPLSEDERAAWIAYGRVRGDRRNSAARLIARSYQIRAYARSRG